MTRRYIIADPDGYGEYSADAGDYWYLPDDASIAGSLVRMDHPWRTVTGHVVYGPRLLKSYPTARDLRRLAKVAA